MRADILKTYRELSYAKKYGHKNYCDFEYNLLALTRQKYFGYPRYLNDIINLFDFHVWSFQLDDLTNNILSDRYDIKTKKLMLEVRDGLWGLKNNKEVINFERPTSYSFQKRANE